MRLARPVWSLCAALVLPVLCVLPGAARPDIAALCERAAERAAAATGVPASVLRAIALTESGRSRAGEFRPWPWTVNMEGKGRWFDSRAEALAYVEQHQARGARSFDVGCFQINHRWHGEAFASVDAMFDPDASARYAAGFLARLHSETGNWSAAAGAYHSRTEVHATRYRARFDRIHAGLTGTDAPAVATRAVAPPVAPHAPAVAADAPNGYPLLGATATVTRLGSLVPLPDGPGARLVRLD